MSISKEDKKKAIEKFATNENDTGSPEVQIAIFSERINNLTNHLKNHKGDNHTRKGLMKMVGKRKRLLNYLSKNNNEKYKSIIKELGLRG
tara:strand:+ start:47 stop:316 length:270 start_codon:yes stop_codon:yes gene_type:complete